MLSLIPSPFYTLCVWSAVLNIFLFLVVGVLDILMLYGAYATTRPAAVSRIFIKFLWFSTASVVMSFLYVYVATIVSFVLYAYVYFISIILLYL